MGMLGFPGFIGAMDDGTHVHVIAPSVNETTFIYGKRFNTINATLHNAKQLFKINLNTKVSVS